ELFFEPKLSLDGTISCANCHNLEKGGDDNLQFSIGINGSVGAINAPTVYNSIYNFRQFWNGRAKNLYEQAVGPIENPIEMNNSFKNVIEFLKNEDKYKNKFLKLYKDGVTKDNIVDSIVEFEKSLVTLDAPFDLYLKGDSKAIDINAQKGYELFLSKGCISCHNGINIGGNLYQKFGVVNDKKSENFGRYEITKNERHRYFFKVPTLRNIELTYPYFHDGSVNSLYESIDIMAKYQLGIALKNEEIELIIAFLKTLTGKKPTLDFDE
ncbi:MAG: c-type cytochrome, partial [Campylobacterales bacterium]|nr:c-type cytochrome [Campylobacterales bacterium]